MTDKIDERLRRVIVEQLSYPIKASEISERTSLYGKGLALASFDIVSLIVRIEDEFDVIVEAEELPGIVATFGTLKDAISKKVGAR